MRPKREDQPSLFETTSGNGRICFYSTRGPHGALSNFSKHPVEIGGKTWPTTEHYFQAQKFAGTEHEEAVRLAPRPGDAARLGRDRGRPLRADWEAVKDDVMRTALRAKVEQHADVRGLLLSTASAELVEHTRNDRYWGDGGDGGGRNMLGQLLMELRDALRDGGE